MFRCSGLCPWFLHWVHIVPVIVVRIIALHHILKKQGGLTFYRPGACVYESINRDHWMIEQLSSGIRRRCLSCVSCVIHGKQTTFNRGTHLLHQSTYNIIYFVRQTQLFGALRKSTFKQCPEDTKKGKLISATLKLDPKNSVLMMYIGNQRTADFQVWYTQLTIPS